MRKPTATQFFVAYAAVIAAADVYVWISAPTIVVASLSVSAVNMMFVALNLVGTCFAFSGLVPWRDDERPKPDWPKSVIFGRMAQTAPASRAQRTVIDSSSWTGHN